MPLTMRLMVGLLYGQRRFYEAAYYAANSLRLTVAALGFDHKDAVLDGAVLLKVNGRIGPDARYCGSACQRAHRADHRASCSACGPKLATAPRAVLDTDDALRIWLALT